MRPRAIRREQLGHSSIKLTVDTYGKWLRKKAPGAVDRPDDAPATESGSRVVRLGFDPVSRPRKLSVGLVDRGGLEPPTS